MASEVEPPGEELGNATLNVSNVTGRDAATAEGIVLTYTSLFVMALAPIIFGSLRSVYYHHDLKVARSYPHDCLLIWIYVRVEQRRL